MLPRTLLNLVLLIGLGGLVALALYEPGIAPPQSATTLTNIAPDSVTRMSLKRPGRADIILTRRKDGEWWMEQPYTSPATPFLMQNLTDLLGAESSADYPLSELDPAAVGLTPPVAILELDRETLRFGDVDPVHGNRYIQAGNRVYLIPEHLAVYTSVTADELISPALLPNNSRIREIRLPALAARAAAEGVKALTATPARTVRRIDGTWTVEPAMELSADGLTRWLDEWSYAQALEVAPLNPETRPEMPADNTEKTIEVLLQDQDRIHFQLLATGPAMIFTRADIGLSYQFSTSQAQRLLYPSSHNSSDHSPNEAPSND